MSTTACAGRIEVGTVVRPPWDQLDLVTSGLLRALLQESSQPGTTTVLDLSAVSFVDSSALGVLVAEHRRLRADGRSLVLTCIHERVLRVLRISGLVDELVVVAPDTALTLDGRSRRGGRPAGRVGSLIPARLLSWPGTSPAGTCRADWAVRTLLLL